MRRPLPPLIAALVLSALVLASAARVVALEVPFLGGRVNDLAGMLDEAAEASLEARLQQLEEATGAQVAVLTVPSLEGDPIEDFAMRVVETWKLGREGVDDGVLILVAREERRMRIEVGYGLEGAVTDAQAGRIIDQLMAPRFREGDFDGGISAAVEAISAAVRGEELPLPEDRPEQVMPDFGTLIFVVLFGLPFINAALSTRGAAAWVIYLFLAPFFFVLPAAVLGITAGLVVLGAWLVGFPLLRLIWPKAPVGPKSRRRGGVYWGPFLGGGGGGGFSGGGGFGGFSGGGGSFGGGGASGGW